VKKTSDVKGGSVAVDPKKIPSGTSLNVTKDGVNAPPSAVVKRDVSPI
jgi:3D (Asp-Asp-Asp) domain-containing protein